MAATMTERDLILNLNAAGFDESLAQEFVDCWKAGKTVEQLRLLAQQRAGLLEQLHREEKQIHWLDYLVYQLRKDEGL